MKLKLSQESSLSPVAINGLKEIISALNQNDYNRALTAHSHLVASTTFGETADFLPAIKVLLHLSHQYLHF
ncbi:protein transport protein Sec31A-like protein [Dinothrombium tinctorium]|uniref:Protein transport protein Sec31A-like protein n=1 Tax=Dinothrombium tinctorium TaxID=1965070 RepID=A0A443RKD8_9ACAR|nr:protein transport protein Sec31A-like protein [Dinothrombium tinctorium]